MPHRKAARNAKPSTVSEARPADSPADEKKPDPVESTGPATKRKRRVGEDEGGHPIRVGDFITDTCNDDLSGEVVAVFGEEVIFRDWKVRGSFNSTPAGQCEVLTEDGEAKPPHHEILGLSSFAQKMLRILVSYDKILRELEEIACQMGSGDDLAKLQLAIDPLIAGTGTHPLLDLLDLYLTREPRTRSAMPTAAE